MTAATLFGAPLALRHSLGAPPGMRALLLSLAATVTVTVRAAGSRRLAEELAAPSLPTCTGNADTDLYPDIVCDPDSRPHLNTRVPDSDTVHARSVECCCRCDASLLPAGELMDSMCLLTGPPLSSSEDHNRCTDIMRHYCEPDGSQNCGEGAFQELADRGSDAPVFTAQQLCMDDQMGATSDRTYECTYIARRVPVQELCPEVECIMPDPLPPPPVPQPVPEPEPLPEPEPVCPPAPIMCSGNCESSLDVVHFFSGYGCELYFPFPSIRRPNITSLNATDEIDGAIKPELCCMDPCKDVTCRHDERRTTRYDFDSQLGDIRPSWEIAEEVTLRDTPTYHVDECCTNRPVPLSHPPPVPEEIYCTGNSDPRFPDVECDGSQHGLNHLKPNSDSIPGRSPFCCCYCDGTDEVLLSEDTHGRCTGENVQDGLCHEPFAYCIDNDDATDFINELSRGFADYSVATKFQAATHATNECTRAMGRVKCDEDGADPSSCEETRPFPTFTERAEESGGQEICLKGDRSFKCTYFFTRARICPLSTGQQDCMCAEHPDTLHEYVPDRVQVDLGEKCCDGHEYCERIMSIAGDSISSGDLTGAQLGASNAPSATVLAAAGFFAAVGLVVVGLTVQRRRHRSSTQQAGGGVASDHLYDHPAEVESGAAGGHEEEAGDDSTADYDAAADEQQGLRAS